MADPPSAMSRPAQLVFIDGLPGSGKTGTAQRLWIDRRWRGEPARWYFEHAGDHPVFSDEAVRAARRTGEAGDLFARALAGYAQLAGQVPAGGETVLLESTLLQTTVGTQLLMDLPPAAIHEHFDRAGRLLAPAEPRCVYFRPPDVAAALRRTAERRGAWFPEFVVSHLADSPRGRRTGLASFDDAIELFREHRALCDALLARFPGPLLTLDNTAGDWPAYMEKIAVFLGWPPVAAWPVPPDYAEFAGRYRAETGDEWAVAADARGLFLDDEAQPRLWPLPDGRFAVEGLCVEVRFERDATGAVRRLHCAAALPGLASHWEKL